MAISASESGATSCFQLDPSHPDNIGLASQGFLAVGRASSTIDEGLPLDIPVPTLSRLAALSGPFQSLQEFRVQKDPNCGRWGGRDKVRHAAIFFAATLGLELFIESTFKVSKTEAFVVSAAIGVLAGLGKEYYDKNISDKDCFSEQDLVANAAGILSAGLVIAISR